MEKYRLVNLPELSNIHNETKDDLVASQLHALDKKSKSSPIIINLITTQKFMR
jgi:hypothetical protein